MEEPTAQCSSLFKHITSHPIFSILTTFFLLILLYLPNLLPLIFSPVLITTTFLLTTLLHFGGSPKPETSHPIFSILTTFFLLILLYLPNLLPLIFSPVLITTTFLLTTLLHFGGSPKPKTPQKDSDPIHIQLETQQAPSSVEFHEQKDILFYSLVEWGRRGGPLEVIYEEYEGEEGNSPEFSQSSEYSHMMMGLTKRLDYFGCGSTESDADSNESLDDMCFRWDEEEEGMIEIALEEDNLIEIDLSACR